MRGTLVSVIDGAFVVRTQQFSSQQQALLLLDIQLALGSIKSQTQLAGASFEAELQRTVDAVAMSARRIFFCSGSCANAEVRGPIFRVYLFNRELLNSTLSYRN